MQWVENLFLLCDQCIFPCILIPVRNRICFDSVTKLNPQNFNWWELPMEMYKQTLIDTIPGVWVLDLPFFPFFRCWWIPAPSSCLCHGNQTRCWGSACSQTCSVSSISSSGSNRRRRRIFVYKRSDSGSCKHGKLKWMGFDPFCSYSTEHCNVYILPDNNLIIVSDSFQLLLCCTFTCAGTFGAKELKFQESGSGAQALPHLPRTAVTKCSSETSAPSKADQSPTSALNPSVPESPTIKRGDYPFRRG